MRVMQPRRKSQGNTADAVWHCPWSGLSRGEFMREFLTAVLTVIAMGVLMIAYNVSGSRVAAAPAGLMQYDPRVDSPQLARTVYAGERVQLTGDPYAPYAVRT